MDLDSFDGGTADNDINTHTDTAPIHTTNPHTAIHTATAGAPSAQAKAPARKNSANGSKNSAQGLQRTSTAGSSGSVGTGGLGGLGGYDDSLDDEFSMGVYGGVGGGEDVQGAEEAAMAAKRMSRDHRTALAKLKDCVDWLMGMLEG